MYLKHLEDYVVELASTSLDTRGEFVNTGEVVSRLMDIIVIEEKLMPDIVVDGDNLDDFNNRYFSINEYAGNISENTINGDVMKSLAWLAGTLIVGGICFLVGFFVAPA